MDLRAPKHRVERVRCRNHRPARQAFFGDLHVHTALSLDAWSLAVRVRPDGAYRYAFGGMIRLPLHGGTAGREVRIDRPLDFAAVTDHAEFLGEQALCLDASDRGYDSAFCQAVRSQERLAPRIVSKIAVPFSWRDRELCGAAGERCAQAAQGVWREVVAAAERWNDASADCQRTTFVGYEYSSQRLMSNLHRNVIFRNAVVPNRPISYLDATREWDLWRLLKERCLDGHPGCDVLAIPHNSNISNGRLFAVDYPGADSREAKRQRAALRAGLEPLVEIMQHKGNSECRNGLGGVLGEDEQCGFEPFVDLLFNQRWPQGAASCGENAAADWMPHWGPDCLSSLSYVRYALIEGLRQERELGVNPFKFGLMASTDTHNATAGGVSERDYPGHLGYGDDTAFERVQFGDATFAGVNHNPGGLVGVWAEENSRDALFELRALENPSCRYSAWQCLAMPPEERPADCAHPQTPVAIQERAWSSPIWYTPPNPVSPKP